MTCFYVSGLVLLYYKTKAQNFINHFSYIGKMSLSCYIIQSFCGGPTIEKSTRDIKTFLITISVFPRVKKAVSRTGPFEYIIHASKHDCCVHPCR